MLFAAYSDLSRRLQYTTGLYQAPIYIAQGALLTPSPTIASQLQETDVLTRYMQRQAFFAGIYPFDRFTRAELGLNFTSLERSDLFVSATIDQALHTSTSFALDSTVDHRAVNYISPFLAYVSDNTLFGYTSPIMGRRFRFQITPTTGGFHWMEYLADYRRYDPVIFNYLWIATRGLADITTGRDADTLKKYLGYPELVRGYDRFTYVTSGCSLAGTGQQYKCSPLLGSRIALANAELRFPIYRRGTLGPLPIPIPPIEGLTFFDAGVVWFGGQSVRWSARPGDDPTQVRTVLRSYGYGLRANLFGFAILRWDYAKPLDTSDRRWQWQFSIGPSF
jgi:outer membrane protein assembly factor BamA